MVRLGGDHDSLHALFNGLLQHALRFTELGVVLGNFEVELFCWSRFVRGLLFGSRKAADTHREREREHW